jgi:two-component system sensor histidine kinase KdpD
LKLNRHSVTWQLTVSITSVVVISFACFLASALIGYKIVALLLLVLVSVLAMLFDIMPVLIAALITALIWNFLFIPPVYTFHINNAEDILLFFMYFIVASINAVMTGKIRKIEKKASIKEEKEKTLKLYNTLLNSLSHELRTPIATIVGVVDTLKEGKGQLTDTQESELYETLDSASMRLNRQVENLLNMNRLESGFLRLKLDWCDMNEMLFRITGKYYGKLTQHKLVFNANEDMPFFRLDQGLIETALVNVIHNAIQYTPEHTLISIGLAHRENLCIITIEDNGKGFPENEISRVFEKFYRLRGSRTGGTGLGLSIAKGCVEAHNGSIKLENKSTGGAKFTLSIPAQTSFINHLKNE